MADEVRDHWWWRPGWRVGQRGYAWHLTFGGQDALHELVRHWQAATWSSRARRAWYAGPRW